MGRKEYSLLDLSPDQFFFRATRHETTPFFSQHRTKLYRLRVGLNDNLGISTGVTVAIAPAFILDADVLDFGCREPLATPQRTDPGEKDALTAVYLQFCSAGQATQERREHGQADRDERRQKKPKKKCHAKRHGTSIHFRRRKPVRNGYAEMVER